MRFLITTLVILLLLLFASLWIGHGSYPEIWKLEDDIAVQKKKNDIQDEKNRQIQAELEDARVGHAAVEERARSELGMTKKGETFFEIILKPEDKAEVSLPLSQDLSGQNKK
ncbi:MAG TPA: cell division protein FtsB [Leucothrix mucor]|nr:cell division protein FtsB [Leucothrix mucor]